MLTTAIGSIVQAILKNIPEDVVKESLDKWLDVVEDKILASSNKIDDVVLLPLIKALRGQLGISETPGSKYEDAT